MSRLVAALLLLAASAGFGAPPAIAGGPQATLYKNPLCGCCAQYVAYLGRAGFHVAVVDTEETEAVKREHAIPEHLYSCHTMVIAGYAVEGHVPLAALKKLLSERPDVRGIALPGMPPASPGMGGAKTAPFVIYTIPKDGEPKLFMTI